jgi:hypothetical protein
MSKHDEIIDKIVERLRFQDEHGVDFHQEPYKGDFFRLFVEAAEEGDGLRADRLGGMIDARAPELLHGKNWALLRPAWPEWDYVWSRAKSR